MSKLTRGEALELSTRIDQNLAITCALLKFLVNRAPGTLVERREFALNQIDRLMVDAEENLRIWQLPEDAVQTILDAARHRLYQTLLETE